MEGACTEWSIETLKLKKFTSPRCKFSRGIKRSVQVIKYFLLISSSVCPALLWFIYKIRYIFYEKKEIFKAKERKVDAWKMKNDGAKV